MEGEGDAVSGTDSIRSDLVASSGARCGPPENIGPEVIYKLYRGARGDVEQQPCRVWVDFTALQVCWAKSNLPARQWHQHVSLLDISQCESERLWEENEPRVLVHILTKVPQTPPLAVRSWRRPRSSRRRSRPTPLPSESPSATSDSADGRQPWLTIVGAAVPMEAFAQALIALLGSRDLEGTKPLQFIQQRLFQYLWVYQGTSMSENQLIEAQAILAFNINPRQGVSYLKEKLRTTSDEELGTWLALMSAKRKGGLEPNQLGEYFSRREHMSIFEHFVRKIDFSNMDLVAALRCLFDTFKPGGEGQVITRILESFAAAYLSQWQASAQTEPLVSYGSSDSVMQVAVSLIMLNTELHVQPKKVNPRVLASRPSMTVEQYVQNTRSVVSEQEVSEEALRAWYANVKGEEISVEPLPRGRFAQLPVQPDIEGWLIAVFSAQNQHRLWAVLALQRLYLFSDEDEFEPVETIDVRDAHVVPVAQDSSAKRRFLVELYGTRGMCQCFARAMPSEIERAFEVSISGNEKQILGRLEHQAKGRIVLVAETSDLCEKWHSLITSGPY